MFIGLDLGTSGLKGVVLAERQRLLAEATAPLTVSRPRSGWSEQAPQDWIDATGHVMAALRAETDLSGVRAIGLSGQMHGATVLDASDAVLRPAILWNDTRAAAEARAMDEDPAFRRITGNIVFPGFTAPKLAWMQAHEPELFARAARVLLPKDYLRLWLTGEAVSEMSDAAGTAWLDVGARDWSTELLAATGLGVGHMPRLVEGSRPSGTLRDALAAEWGLPRGVVVAGGAGDNAASAVGVGVAAPGDGFLSLGTSGVLFAATEAFRPMPETAVHTFCHALPDTWHQMGVILAASDALSWLARVVGRSPAQLTGALGGLEAPGRTLFLPYLGGERTPHNDAGVRGAFLGLEHAADTAALTRAVLEGVTHAFADCQAALAQTGTRLERLIAIGGGSHSDYWLEALATGLQMEIDLPVSGDFGAAFGAARLAMMADGAGPEVIAAPETARRIAPNPALTEAFAEAHERNRAAYAAVRSF